MKYVLSILIVTGIAGAEPLLDTDDMAWLQTLTSDVIEASRVQPGAKVGDIGPNISGGVLIRPGGRTSYPAFWIRDYAMSLECGLIPQDEQRHMLLLTAAHQEDDGAEFPSGSVAPPGSVPDHIGFGGKPIFYPGTLEDYEGQGGKRWGDLPSLDDQFYFIQMAAEYVRQFDDVDILRETVNGKTLFERLEAAYRMPPSRRNGLVYTTEDKRGVNFGFYDTTIHTGELLFCSVLKTKAASDLADLAKALGMPQKESAYRSEQQRLREAIVETFSTDSGWLRASTGLSAQPDVWGTAYAVYTGTIEGEAARAACETLAKALRDGTIAWRGQIRHVPTTDDFSDETAWERSLAPKNRYQNGAYWATPAGWVCYAIAQVNPEDARTLALELVNMLRETDFRQGDDRGGPWECMHPDGDHKQNPVYMTSVTCPLAAFRRINE